MIAWMRGFEDYFIDSTLRIDYFHTGDAKEELLAVDQMLRQGTWAGNPRHLLDPFNTFNHRALATWIFCMIVMVVTSLLTAPPAKAKTDGIIWNKSYLSLLPEDRQKYRGLKDWRLWWGVFVGIVLFIYAFFLWYRIQHPW